MVRSKATHASVSTTSTLGGLMVRNRPKLVVRPVRGVSCGFRLERSCFTSAVQASTRRALVAVPDDRPERGCNLAKDASAHLRRTPSARKRTCVAFIDLQKLLRCCAAPASAWRAAQPAAVQAGVPPPRGSLRRAPSRPRPRRTTRLGGETTTTTPCPRSSGETAPSRSLVMSEASSTTRGIRNRTERPWSASRTGRRSIVRATTPWNASCKQRGAWTAGLRSARLILDVPSTT